MIAHCDLLASYAALTGQELPAKAGPDSVNVLPALLDGKAGRTDLVEHGDVLGFRQGTWKFVPGPGQDGGELYDLSTDLGEQHNLVTQHPDKAKAMAAELAKIKQRSVARPD